MAQYVVTGTRTFQGYQPGEVFEADFTEAEEARYKGRSSIADATGTADTDLTALTRDDLNKVAADAGIESPEGFPKKGDLIEAIEDKKSAGESGGDEKE
jgi:hypothetical protein